MFKPFSSTFSCYSIFKVTKTRSDIEVKWEDERGSKVNGYLVMVILNVPE
jgi:hypothetical protein